MNHPKPEELTDYLYDELAPARREEIAEHLRTCDVCAQQIASWRGVQRELASWQTPMRERLSPKAGRAFAAPARWAAAAAIFLAAGYGIARMTSPSVDPARLRAELAKDLRSEVRQEIVSEMTRYSDQQLAQQAEFQQGVTATIEGLAARQVAEHATLRKDVETVAIRTQEEFNRIALLDHFNTGAAGINR